jgi:peptidyl-prolyl cis-trans isomerase SurA
MVTARCLRRYVPLLLWLAVALPTGASAQARPPAQPLPVPGAASDSARIVAVVNGDVISEGDVDNRRRLFALSTGLPMNPDVLAHLTPQITKQLIDEKLRLQEIQRRRIAVSDDDIAHAIAQVEQRNGMPPGTLRRKLQADGVEMRTLIDQIRVQIGWTRVLRDVLGPQMIVSEADIADRLAGLKAEIGQPEYRLGEIFIPIENPQGADEAGKFADTVIGELREGAPFGVAAAQFSQAQNALQGGDLGWVEANSLDPAVVRVLDEMPPGAISNPIRVPGGIDIVTLRGKRQVGQDVENVLHVRQAFIPFSTPLNPQAPTAQQKQVLDEARKLSATATSCADIEAANKQFGSGRTADPGPLQVDSIPPQMRAVFDRLQPGHASEPLVAQDGIAVVMVCARDQQQAGLPSKTELADRILDERVERISRQLMRDLERRAVIEQRA